MKERTATRIARIVALVCAGIVAAVILGFLLGLAVMLLWNWLMPDLFGLPRVSYWQAVGLLALCHLLFKSHISRPRSGSGGKRQRRFKERVREKLHEREAQSHADSEEGSEHDDGRQEGDLQTE